jgi:hypoxanthine phosphoribosyltransferase
MNYRSFSDLSSLIENNIQNIPWDIDLVVGIPRSGLLVANMIALLMNKTLTDLNGYLDNRLIASGNTKNVSPKLPKDCKKVLIVEDSVDSGASIISCKEKMSSIKDVEFIYLAAYVEPGKEKMVDIFFDILPHPRVFEWNLFHHKGVISNSCFDIHGV